MALRGWGRDDFDYVSRDFRDAVRFALFAEKAAPMLGSLEQVAGMTDAGMDLTNKARLAGAKVAAIAEAARIRAILEPED